MMNMNMVQLADKIYEIAHELDDLHMERQFIEDEKDYDNNLTKTEKSKREINQYIDALEEQLKYFKEDI